MEVLAIKIRKSVTIRGIQVTGVTFKISQYCDDTTLFVENDVSAKQAIDEVRDFGSISGLQLNIDKCDFMRIGKRKNCREFVCGRQPVLKIKILGVWFSATENCNDVNAEAVGEKSEER